MHKKNNCNQIPNPCPGTTLIGVIGPTGPTGPTGPAGTTPAALDSILVDNDGTQTVTANNLVNLGTIINQTGETMIYTAPDTVSLEPGTYYILYETLVSNTSTAGDVGASLQINNVTIPNASEYVPATSTQTQIVLQHNVTLTSLSTVTVENASTVSNEYHDSSLSIIKIG